MKQFLRHIFLLLALFMVTTNAWALRYAKAIAKSSPEQGGWVWVTKTNGNAPSTWDKTEDSSEDYNLKTSNYTFPFYYYAKPQEGYEFKGWATTSNTNTLSSTVQNNWYVGVTATSSNNVNSKPATATYFAIFAKLTTNVVNLNFEKNVDEGWGAEKSLVITYVHAGDVTANISGEHASDFSFSNSSLITQKTIASNNTDVETSQEVYIYFNPSSSGNRVATLTLSGNGMSKTVVLNGKGNKLDQTLSWNNESAIEANMQLGKTQIVTAAASSGLTVTYSSSDNNVLTVDASGKITAVGIGTATITASQAGNYKYNAARSITKSYTVWNKNTPVYTPNGFNEANVCHLKVGDKVTLEVLNVSDGLSGDFKVETDNNILGITRNGNTITIEALNAGTADAIFTQTENNDIFGVVKKYQFSITKIDNTLAIASSSYTKYVDDEIANIISSVNSDAAVTTESTDATIAYYDVASDKILIPNSEAKSFSSQEITITIAQAETYKYTAAEKTITLTINKHTPEFTLNPAITNSPEKLYFNELYPDYFTINANSPMTMISSDTLVAKWVPGSNGPQDEAPGQSYTLKTLSKTNIATLTAILHETYYWQRWEGSMDIQLQNARNHVPLKIESETDMTNLRVSNTYNLTWDNGVDLQGGNWADKYYVFKFEGYPKEITFNYTVNSGGVTGYSWSVEQSNENGNWGNKKSWSSDSYSGSGSLTLDKDTRYIRLRYSGNGHGKFYDINVSRLEEFYLCDKSGTKIDTLNFNIDEKGDPIKNKVNNPCSITVDFKYANIGHDVKLSTNDPQHFTLSKTSFNNLGGVKEGSEKLTITYVSAMPYEAVDKELTIIDELGDTLIIPLIATTEKKEQVIEWNCDRTLAIGQVVNDAATALSGGAITYTTDNEAVIQIINNGTAFQAIAAGSAKIAATQAGNTEWKAVSDTLEFTVTGKKVQFIHWSDNLTRLKLGDAPITLTATAEVLVDPENGVTETLPERTELITYTSADPNVVSVEGNVLTINGVGSTTITAELPGDAFEYEAATVSMPVTVTIPSNTCEAYVLNAPEEVSRTYSLVWDESIYEPAEFTGPAHILTFEARKNNSTAVGNIEIQQLVNGVWQKIDDANPGTDWRSYHYELDSTATKIRFYNGYGSYTRYFKNVLVSQRTYLKTTTPEIVVDYSIVGDEITRPIIVQYSNISAGVLIEHNSNKISLSASELDSDCGKYGEQVITVYARIAEVGTIVDTVTIHDEATGKKIVIPITISAQQTAQTLYWEAPTDPIASCYDLDLPTHTTADLALEWSVSDGSKSYADIDANGNLQIFGTGTVILQASNSGNNIYESFERTYTIRVEYNPIFLGAEGDDWNTPSNWNICRVPEVAELASRNLQVQAPMTLTEELTVAGITLQEDASISIAETAGLTIGAEGITGTNADGSSIVIKNTPTGAGYFRMDSTAQYKPAKATVKYTTKTYDQGYPRYEVWQYIGMPGENAHMEGLNSKVSIYNWDETCGWLKQDYTPETNIPAWTGYAFTQSQDENATFTIKAEPIFAGKEISFTCTASGMRGDNLLVNSYLAPIDITKIEPEDVIDPENKLTKTFFFFNAGSWNDWKDGAGDITANGYDQSSAGHYYSVPFYSSRLMKSGDTQLVIPSMQGVYVYTEALSSIKLNYTKHVYGADAANNLNQPMRAPEQKLSDNFRRVCIQAVSENSGADRMYVIQDESTTPDYDNGYDGDNIIASGQVNIYTSEHFGQMEVSCSNDIDSMYIGFTAGEDSEYMLNFSAVVGDDLYLYDTDADLLLPLIDGEQYAFYAAPNSVNNSRFLIIKKSTSNPDDGQGGVATDVENLPTGQNLCIHNNIVYVSEAPANSSLSVYATNGALLAGPYTINHAPYTLKLDLPAGVYMLRLNNHVYKFVCQ